MSVMVPSARRPVNDSQHGGIAAQRREGPAASRPFQRYGCLAQRKPTLTRDLDGASMARKA